jgi:hypothetical protein
MKTYLYRTATFIALLAIHLSVSLAQGTTGAIARTVVDQTGAIMPNATATLKGESGQEFNDNTSDNGTYNIPAVAAGFCTVTVTSTNFKTTIVQNVKVDVGVPATVDATLETGGIEETVVVTSGADEKNFQLLARNRARQSYLINSNFKENH